MKRKKHPKLKRVPHWIKQIDFMLEWRKYKFAHDTLRSIKKTIEETETVTDSQIQAIKNIRWGKDNSAKIK